MVLVDTSIWIDHFRVGEPRLSHLLTEGLVLMHPFVFGELACGNLKNRVLTLKYLDELPDALTASHSESVHILDSRKLWADGIGWIDLHLLASALITNCEFWTRDARLDGAARASGVKRFSL